MTILDSYSIYALLVSNTLLLGATTLTIVRFQRQQIKLSKFWDNPTGRELQPECDQKSINQINGERLASLQDAVSRLEHIDTCIPPPPERLPFENTVRMAKAGASIDDLVRTCGLSHGEASLFMRIHAKAAA